MTNVTEKMVKMDKDPSALIRAAYLGRFDVMEMLLALGTNVNAKDGAGMTPILVASSQNHIDIDITNRKANVVLTSNYKTVYNCNNHNPNKFLHTTNNNNNKKIFKLITYY